jgi:hypothetical protein
VCVLGRLKDNYFMAAASCKITFKRESVFSKILHLADAVDAFVDENICWSNYLQYIKLIHKE